MLACVVFGDSLRAQVRLSAGACARNFDSLATNGSAPWQDNFTLPGWYASRSAAPGVVTAYSAGAGASIAGGIYSFGAGGSPDRALGALASGGTGALAFGVRLVNDTGAPQTDFRISCSGEQWRAGNSNPRVLEFSFQVGTALTNADAGEDRLWTRVTGLDFWSPNTNATQALDGNEPTNRAAFAGVPLPGVVVPPGEELFLRWRNANGAGYDDAMAVDDFSVSFHPGDTNTAVARRGAFSLLTYNTHGHSVENWSTNAAQAQAIGRQLRFLAPDIVCLNEIPHTNTWQMANWVAAFLPGYFLATNSGTDGYIRSVIASRFPITRSRSWLCNADLSPFGFTNAAFKRDLFEAQIAVPDFPRPLHVFAVHLKSGQYTGELAERAAQAAAISNFFAAGFLTTNALEPYVLCGDFNEDLARPTGGVALAMQRLLSAPTGLRLATPLNPFTGSERTFSIQAGEPVKRYDYILPCALLASNVAACEVFRTDRLPSLPASLRADDDARASDHLPVLMVFNNPYRQPFRFISVTRVEGRLTLKWESVPGQRYCVESSGDMRHWTVVAENLVASDGAVAFTIEAPAQAQFFRVRRS